MRPRNCKIVATLGPASDPPERLQAVFEAGVDAFRVNFGYGGQDDHKRRIDTIRDVEREVGRPIPVIADLQGPKIRVGAFKGGGITLKRGQSVALRAADETASESCIPLPHPELLEAIQTGDTLKLDDGRLELSITETGAGGVTAKVIVGGLLTDNKGVNAPSRVLPIPALTEKDRDNLEFALDAHFDFVALSFVQDPKDVVEARKLIRERANILVKIEKPSAIDSLDEIIRLADAVIIARGDLGVELPPEQVPTVQRRVISKCRSAGKPVIVATHMLESMIEAPTPTRAEASDVATAVYQGADAVMLSAESAVGRHPATAVAIMDRIIRAVEDDPDHWSFLAHDDYLPEATSEDAISLSARQVVDLLKCKAILAFTNTGSTALRMSRKRPRAKVFGLTPNRKVARQLALAWGIHSVITEDITNFNEMVTRAEEVATGHGGVQAGELIVVTAGIPFGRPGTTNTMKIIRVGGE